MSEVCEGDFEDVIEYNTYRMRMAWCRFSLGLYGTINGYHHFRIKPSENDKLKCIREHDNRFDKNAIMVAIAPKTLAEEETTVGRVPRKCAKRIANFLN